MNKLFVQGWQDWSFYETLNLSCYFLYKIDRKENLSSGSFPRFNRKSFQEHLFSFLIVLQVQGFMQPLNEYRLTRPKTQSFDWVSNWIFSKNIFQVKYGFVIDSFVFILLILRKCWNIDEKLDLFQPWKAIFWSKAMVLISILYMCHHVFENSIFSKNSTHWKSLHEAMSRYTYLKIKNNFF